MRRTKGVLLLLTAALLFSACKSGAEEVDKVEPMSKKAVADTGFYRLTLTDKAIERLDVQTAEVTQQNSTLAMPYGALLYDLNGDTWVYVNVEPNVFVRQSVMVDVIRNDQVVLRDGPEAGTKVVSVAAAELYGAETGIGK